VWQRGRPKACEHLPRPAGRGIPRTAALP
jgi:hypothetical protein